MVTPKVAPFRCGERGQSRSSFSVLQLQLFRNIFQVQMTRQTASQALRPEPGPVVTKAVLSAAKRLDLRNKELAAIIGTSEAFVSRLKSGRSLDPQRTEGQLALLFLRLYRSLDALVGGDDQKARAWLHDENDHVRGIPADRIRTVEGLVDVVQYLDAMRGRL
jgi:hypothetical protein